MLYEILVNLNEGKPTAQNYYETLFPNYKPDWKCIYLLPRRVRYAPDNISIQVIK